MSSKNQAEILNEIFIQAEKEADTKVGKAMKLFLQVDDSMKSVFICVSGFNMHLDARTLKEHFHALDLLDELDGWIEAFDDELDSYVTG